MESKLTAARCPDYQFFSFDADGHVCDPGERMKKKLQAIPLPDLAGKRVLDVGCDFGFWSFLASNRGAKEVIGLDRGRPISGKYFDLIKSNREVAAHYNDLENVNFQDANIGKEWPQVGKFDVIFLFSLYHHIFENCGDHYAIWFWLYMQCDPKGVVVWENPVDVSDGVAYSNISKDKHSRYTVDAIIDAAGRYFDIEYKGPALHEPTRHVYYFHPRASIGKRYIGKTEDGARGATKAFEYDNHRRGKEIAAALGFHPWPGSLNIRLEESFDWSDGYYVADILDVVNRAEGFNSEWGPRRARFYPVKVNGERGFVMRFDGENEVGYPRNFVEVIASVRLRDNIKGETVLIERA